MPVIDVLMERAKAAGKNIVLPEGQDPRVVEAANKILDRGIAEKVFVIGTEDEISGACAEVSISERKFDAIDHTKSEKFNSYAESFCELRRKKGKEMNMEKAFEVMKNRIFYGCMMTRLGDADGMVAGSIASTPDMLRGAFTVIGTMEGIKTGSSCFIMDLANPTPAGDDVLLYSDSGVNPNPNAGQLVDIAMSAAHTYRALFRKTPKIAFLSFSTYGSADHEILDKIRVAASTMAHKVEDEKLDIIVEAKELQADAALVPAIAEKKCGGGKLGGKANILIFPDLNCGNICYKLTERLAGAAAYGPILQGLAKPVNDLSRGCSADDIVGVAAITICQSLV
jgi:phosphate acetyltransferase